MADTKRTIHIRKRGKRGRKEEDQHTKAPRERESESFTHERDPTEGNRRRKGAVVELQKGIREDFKV